MDKKYHNIWYISHNEIYSFIKANNIQVTDYTFEKYFDYIVSKYNTKVIEHHFENDLILGLTMIDELGFSLSYEKESILTRQNFTKCHEIGHIILNHKGSVFTELEENRKPIELEADYFASILLAPDIVLLNHILYENLNFKEISNKLQISHKALSIRLRQFIEKYSNISFHKANGIVSSFKANTSYRIKLLQFLKFYEKDILQNYESIKTNPITKFEYLNYSNKIITSLVLKEIENLPFRNIIKNKYPSIKFWAYHNKGITIWYAWDTTKITDTLAHQEAKNILLLMTS
ncbi:ImmA/IrrE family metallo-endopeptidase [Streptococcus uberis]|uniref:ImmA/IrrE family metallo-endopeptidase n=1 Tax=Streptococcus uberis TaxID=1349 RepID=UPI001FF174D0|nr:ImmA/IrrE family metallo-endopeptidase [Streptococcus uberis]MCK1160458.1 ImmA/IrrE family metallo-endopeptidase [Streptococcus uberis]MCK1162249.1 ImmA/IrrE family metallo-endopeptidase [Streptococcus uberis]